MKQNNSKRRQQAIESREKIFNAAIEIMSETGIDGITIDAIQERTGYSRGLFYNYFRSINDIISEIVGINEQQYQIIRDQFLIDCHGFEKILLFVQYVAELHADPSQKNQLRIHYLNLIKNEKQGKLIRNADRLPYSVLHEALTECISDGLIDKNTDCQQVTSDIMTILRGSVFEFLLSGDSYYDLVAHVANMTSSYLSGIQLTCERILIPSIVEIGDSSITSMDFFNSVRKVNSEHDNNVSQE